MDKLYLQKLKYILTLYPSPKLVKLAGKIFRSGSWQQHRHGTMCWRRRNSRTTLLTHWIRSQSAVSRVWLSTRHSKMYLMLSGWQNFIRFLSIAQLKNLALLYISMVNFLLALRLGIIHTFLTIASIFFRDSKLVYQYLALGLISEFLPAAISSKQIFLQQNLVFLGQNPVHNMHIQIYQMIQKLYTNSSIVHGLK